MILKGAPPLPAENGGAVGGRKAGVAGVSTPRLGPSRGGGSSGAMTDRGSAGSRGAETAAEAVAARGVSDLLSKVGPGGRFSPRHKMPLCHSVMPRHQATSEDAI